MDAQEHLDRGNYWTAAKLFQRRRHPQSTGAQDLRITSDCLVVPGAEIIAPHACTRCGTTHAQNVCPWCHR